MGGNSWDAKDYDERFAFVGELGDDLLALLEARPGEAVLDLGCGTGRHAATLAAAGVDVVGVDADEAMLDEARRNHPDVAFAQVDVLHLSLAALGRDRPFDACISNAALHWMTPQEQALRNVRGVLRVGGRFVAEMGGAGNINALDRALRSSLAAMSLDDATVVRNYFPTVGEQAALLEDCGFRVEDARWFRRPTPLTTGVSASDWTKQFRAATWQAVPTERHQELEQRIDRYAAELGLRDGDGWFADYCRLRFVAVAA
jgi:trans-aconitate methyltransferase